MEEHTKKKRSPNFTEEDCMRLADIMAEDSDIEGVALNKHKFLKHRFTNVVTSKSKKEMWACVTTQYNSSAVNPRSTDDLEKKWFNLVSRQRSLYADYKRDSLLTGGGKGPKQPSALTDAVMAAIGKDSASVSGIASGSFLNDSTLLNLQLENALGDDSGLGTEDTSIRYEAIVEDASNALASTSVDTNSKTCCCQHKIQLFNLKKRKLELEIQLLEKKLKEWLVIFI